MEDYILDGITEKAWDAFSHWRTLTPEARCLPLAVMADILKQRRDAIAVMMASEMGKPVTQGLAEADKCALLCRWYADHAPGLLRPEMRPSSAHSSNVVREPQGIILGIMPWKFPLLAGIPVHRSGICRRQCGIAEACLIRSQVCPGN